MNDEVEIGSVPRYIRGVKMSAVYYAEIPVDECEVEDFQIAVERFGIETVMRWGVMAGISKISFDAHLAKTPGVEPIQQDLPRWWSVEYVSDEKYSWYGNGMLMNAPIWAAIGRSKSAKEKQVATSEHKNDDGHIPDSPYLKTERGAVALTKLATIAYEIAAPSGSKRPKSSQKIAKIVEQMNKSGARPASVSSWTHYCVDRILSKYLPPFSNGSPSREEAKAILDSPLRPIPKAQALYRLRKNGGKA